MAQGTQTQEISFLGTGDCGPVHGPKDGFRSNVIPSWCGPHCKALISGLVIASGSTRRVALPVKPRRTDGSRRRWLKSSPIAALMP